MALKGAVSGVVILSVVLLSSCGAYRLNNEETDRAYLKRELDELEYEMAAKSFYSELFALFNDISTTKYPTTTMAPTTMAPTTTKSSTNGNYIQHIVNCFKSYKYATAHGLSERNYIYNIVVVQCMSDPKVDRLVKLLTAYDELINEDTKNYDAYDVVEWLFEIFNDDKENKEDSDINEETDIKEETDVIETTTIIAPNPTTPESESTTSEHKQTTTVPNQTTNPPRETTTEGKQTSAKVVTTSSFTNEIDEDNDEEAVKELLLQRVLMLLRKDKLASKDSTLR